MWIMNPKLSTWEDFLNKAKQLINIKDYNSANTCISKAIQLKGDEHILYKIRSSINVKLNKYDAALLDCQKMIQLKPEDGDGYVRVSKLLSEMNNKRGAYQICVIALKKVPSTDKYYHIIEKLMETYKGKRKNVNKLLKSEVKRFKANKDNTNFNIYNNGCSSNNNRIQNNQKNYFILPYEILSRVFSELRYRDLYYCMITCKRWYECIINNKFLWRDINLSNLSSSRLCNSNTIQFIAKRSQNMLRSLDLSNCTAITDGSLRPLLLYRCNGIETFKLSGNSKITKNGIIKLLKIIGLNLINLTLQSKQVDDYVIENIFNSCPKIEYLDLSENINLSPNCFLGVYNLHRNIYNIKGLRFKNISSICDKTIQICAALFPSLEILDLYNCNMITKSALLSIGSFTELKDINLTGTAMNVPDNILLEDSFLYLFEKCQKVEKISFRQFPILSDPSIEILCGFCSNLREIDISYSINITDHSLNILSNFLKYTLRSLNISYCPLLTNEGLLYIFDRCEKLTDLDISNNPNISDYLFKTFKNSDLPLINFYASNCDRITGNGLIAFIKKLRDTLLFVNIDYCHISNSTLNFIYHKFPHIKFSSKLEKFY